MSGKDELEETGLVPYEDQVPEPVARETVVQSEEPRHFRSLYRRALTRALVSHAALEQFHLEVKAAQAGLKTLVDLLEADPTVNSQNVMGRIMSLERRIKRLDIIVKFARRQLNSENYPMVIPSHEILANSHRRLDGLDLRELEAVRKEYSQLAHDVNNMLSVAMGNAQLLLFVRNNREQLGARFESIGMALERADGDIEESLGKRNLNNQSVAAVPRVVEGTKTILDSGLEIEVTSDPNFEEQTAAVGISPSNLSRLLFDLMDNAKKAGATHVKVDLRLEGKELLIQLKDNGPGFKGVEPLAASKASKAQSSNNGNGLPICFNFCRKAGGSLKLENPNDPTGATWTIQLPFLKGRR